MDNVIRKPSIYRFIELRIIIALFFVALVVTFGYLYREWQQEQRLSARIAQSELNHFNALLSNKQNLQTISIYLNAYYQAQASPKFLKVLQLQSEGSNLLTVPSNAVSTGLKSVSRAINIDRSTTAELILYYETEGLGRFLVQHSILIVISILLQISVSIVCVYFFMIRSLRRLGKHFLDDVSYMVSSTSEFKEQDLQKYRFQEASDLLKILHSVMKKLQQTRFQLAKTNESFDSKVTERTAMFEQKNAELVMLNERLSLLANTDSMTQVYNRSRFDVFFQENVDVSNRRHTKLSLLIIDLDDFKKINDQYGHQSGDEALKETASILRDITKDQGIVARWGGEEFVILLPYFDIEGAMEFAETIRKTVAESTFTVSHILLTVSIGVAEKRPDEPTDTILMRADDALYESKNKGRNRVTRAKEIANETYQLFFK